MKHFLIYTNRHKDVGLRMTDRICRYLEEKGQEYSIRMQEADQEIAEAFSETDFPIHADYMIVLGGDGTMLQAAREQKKQQIPLIGVNLGTLGYMTEIETGNIEEALQALIEGNFQTEMRMMLSGRIFFRDGRAEKGYALNDIVIVRSGSLRIIRYHIYVNGQFLNGYSADGVIVTTPTGSTGYNLSAGGPIVEPRASLIVLTPICPHTLNQRSIILSPEDVIEIEIPKGSDGQEQVMEASFDGSQNVLLQTGDRIRIEKSEKITEIIQLNQVSFLEVLHHKLSES